MAKSKAGVRKPAQSRNAAARKARAGATKATGAKRRASSSAKGTKSRRSATTKVLGVSVPKGLTDALDNLVNSARGREILASALVAAASAAAAALVRNPDSPQPDQVAEATKDLSEVAAGALAEIVTGAARSFLPKSMTGTAKRKA